MKLTYDVLSTEPATGFFEGNGGGRAMVELDGKFFPKAPTEVAETGIDREVLENLALKLAFTVPKFNTQWAAQRMCLPLQLVADLLDELRADQQLEVLGTAGHFSYNFAITNRGCDQARRLMEISGYVGPAPVSLDAYTSHLEFQFSRLPKPTRQQIFDAVDELILPEETVEVAGLAMLARRSLFLYGPPGNGKTCLGHMLHDSAEGALWIPHCIGINDQIIKVFDPECHELCDSQPGQELAGTIDRRWVQVKRPFIVVGGELTLDMLDLLYSPSHGYYEAPLHFKANGGTFLLDDFGCQKVDPEKILNRWIHPLERGVDFLTLETGQQLEVPFRQMLIVSTNMDVNNVMTPAFLRRMGYRLHMDDPPQERYAEIFQRYAARLDLAIPEGLINHVLDRYRDETRPMHGCEPRDLIERSRDICELRDQPLQLSNDVVDLAWRGYFGQDMA